MRVLLVLCAGVALVGALVVSNVRTSRAAGSAVAPDATLDQAYPSRASACRYSGWSPDSANEWVAETFTAGVSGSLTDVVLWVRVSNPRNPVAIAPVDGAGRPDVSRPLASTTLTDATAVFAPVPLSFAAPARVEAGTQYALVLFAPAAGAWVWKADLGSSTIDPGGGRCADGAYAGGRMWFSSLAAGADADFFFQTYVVPARHVTVEKIGTGTGTVQDGSHAIDCGSSCSGEFLQGQSVTLTAAPDPGSVFSGWSGVPCRGAEPTCSVPVGGGDLPVTAEFTRKLVTLSVARVGRGAVTSLPAGISCGRVCRHGFAPGPVKLTARPFRGWRFTRWRGACRGTRPACTLALLRRSSVVAVFTRA